MAAPHSPLKSGPSSVSSPAMAGTTGPASTTPGTVDFLLSTPPQVLILLSHAAPLLRGLTEAAKILTWKHSNRWSSFSVLLAWWLLCLLGDRVASYGIGPTLIASLALSYLLKKPQQPTSRKRLATQVMDADKLARVLEDARQCQHALSDFYVTYADPLRDLFTWQDPAYTRRVIYLLATSFPTYLAFTALFGTRYIFLIVGSCLFLAPSKFGKVLWINTRRSFILRLLLNLAFSVFIAGGQDFKRIWRRTRNAKLIFLSDLQTSQPPTSLDDSTVRMPPALVKEPSSVPSDISFTFTIFQNERWWIGLDWTQALLPSERPAW